MVMVIVTLLNTPKKGFFLVNSTTNEYNNNKQNIYVQ